MRFIKLPEVIEITGISRSSIYDLSSKGKFPAKVQLTPTAIGWVEEEVLQWMEQQAANRANTQGGNLL